MNQNALYSNYTDNQRTSETTRESEARALLNCSSKLKFARDPKSSREELGEAVKLNQRLWTLFQVSLCEPDNQLPHDLKITLLSLSRYVDKTSFQILANNDRGMISSLININRTLAKGLSMNNEVQPTTGQATQTQATQTDDAPPPSVFTSA